MSRLWPAIRRAAAATTAAACGQAANTQARCDDRGEGQHTVTFGDWERRLALLSRHRPGSAEPGLQQPLSVYLTGFGPFGNITDNPTSAICRRLSAQAAKAEMLSRGIRLLGLDVVEVSAEAARAKARAIAEELRDVPGPVCVIHMGVAAGRPQLSLEARAVNLAHFPIPDVKGWVANKETIVSGAPEQQHTALPISELLCELHDAGVQCEISSSAGTYICNYIYYNSLHEVGRAGVPVLFVHTPDFSTLPEQEQVRNIEQLLLALRRLTEKDRLGLAQGSRKSTGATIA